MIVPVAVLVVVAVVVAAHRSLDGLAAIRLSRWWLLAVALGLQVLVIQVVPDALPGGVAAALHVVSYVAALAFVVTNRRYRGLLVVGLGGALNLVAIAANDGVMPASESAVEAAGLDHGAGSETSSEQGFENSAPVDDADLWFLGDVFAVPEPLPLANVFSVGDVVVVAGAGLLVHESTRAARRRDPSGAGAQVPAVGR